MRSSFSHNFTTFVKGNSKFGQCQRCYPGKDYHDANFPPCSHSVQGRKCFFLCLKHSNRQNACCDVRLDFVCCILKFESAVKLKSSFWLENHKSGMHQTWPNDKRRIFSWVKIALFWFLCIQRSKLSILTDLHEVAFCLRSCAFRFSVADGNLQNRAQTT